MCIRKENEMWISYALRFIVEHTAEAFIVMFAAAAWLIYMDNKELSETQNKLYSEMLITLKEMNIRLERLENYNDENSN